MNKQTYDDYKNAVNETMDQMIKACLAGNDALAEELTQKTQNLIREAAEKFPEEQGKREI